MKLDDFTKAYIECSLWSSTDDKGEPLDSRFGIEDIAPETLETMKADCQRFQTENAELLGQACADESISVNQNPGRSGGLASAGHDFWLTRNGHGAGFWDGDWGTYGDKLTEASKAFGGQDIYSGDDGKLYV